MDYLLITVNYLLLLIPQILESRQFCKPHRLAQENIDLNVLSVTDMLTFCGRFTGYD